MKPRILFLNRSYWPDAEATGQLLTDLTEDLADRFDVHVLAGQPNHIAGSSGEFADVQTRNGVTIHRATSTFSVNGKSYPATEAVKMKVGQTALFRLVGAGAGSFLR